MNKNGINVLFIMLSNSDYNFLRDILQNTIYKRFHAFYELKPDFFDECIRKSRQYILDEKFHLPELLLKNNSFCIPEKINQIILFWKSRNSQWYVTYFDDNLTDIKKKKLPEQLVKDIKSITILHRIKFKFENIEFINNNIKLKRNILRLIMTSMNILNFVNSFNNFIQEKEIPLEFKNSSIEYFKTLVQQSNRSMPGYENPDRQNNEKYIKYIMESIKFLVYILKIPDQDINQFVGTCELRDLHIDLFTFFKHCSDNKIDNDIKLSLLDNFIFCNYESHINKTIIPLLNDDYFNDARDNLEKILKLFNRNEQIDVIRQQIQEYQSNLIHKDILKIKIYINYLLVLIDKNSSYDELKKYVNEILTKIYENDPISIIRECVDRTITLLKMHNYLQTLNNLSTLSIEDRLKGTYLENLINNYSPKVQVLIDKYKEDKEIVLLFEKETQDMNSIISPNSLRRRNMSLQKTLTRAKYGGSKIILVKKNTSYERI